MSATTITSDVQIPNEGFKSDFKALCLFVSALRTIGESNLDSYSLDCVRNAVHDVSIVARMHLPRMLHGAGVESQQFDTN